MDVAVAVDSRIWDMWRWSLIVMDCARSWAARPPKVTRRSRAICGTESATVKSVIIWSTDLRLNAVTVASWSFLDRLVLVGDFVDEFPDCTV